ncbi:putative nucleotidyltransferases [Candidatus Termititenax aidoneus]|uniref:Nucleotidyltransferases n=1 Tax=Termititenax aidoneus TaxID=2218524 RepID=A0A388TBD6_TERA1|nr:putative nucleotidyltransferases [Candidatus Termititenax aidoneus]
MSLAISEKQLALIKQILARQKFKAGAAYVFGSRARGTAREYSDLDLAVDNNGGAIPPKTILRLMLDFENSLLPYKVDIVDLNNISAEFKSLIIRDLVRLN